MKPAQIYTYTIPANGSVRILVEGSFIKILACTGAVAISGDFGTLGPILAGQGQKDSPSKSYAVNDLSGAVNMVRVLIADSGFIDDRISGEVSVIDGGKFRTIAGTAFQATCGTVSDATTGPAVYLQNPIGSGKNIIVKSLRVSLSVASEYLLVWVNSVTGADNSAAGIVSKSNSGIFTSKIYTHTTGASSAGTLNALVTALLSANQVDTIVFSEPIVIRPGNQIMLKASGVSNFMKPSFECFEESTT